MHKKHALDEYGLLLCGLAMQPAKMKYRINNENPTCLKCIRQRKLYGQ